MINLNQKIEEILTRSVAEILPSKEELKKVLLSGKKLKIYIGIDATAPDLHLGHATNFMLLEKLRKLGHEIIVLFGDFTAMIGDPTDKTAARIRLTKNQVEENIKTWKKQIEKIFNFKDKKNPPKIVKNSKWFSKLTLSDLIEIASNFTVQRMLERDMFEKRLKEEKPIYLHEFLYPLMQGYDSVVLNVDVEVGGTDQIFNMLAGRILQKRYNNKEKFIIATNLLVNPKTGKKLMSKSEGSYISLSDDPNNMFGKIMALPDEVIVQLLVNCTYLPIDEIKKIEFRLSEKKMNPVEAKKIAAYEIVKIYHGEKKAQEAKEEFDRVFKKRELPENIPIKFIEKKPINILNLLVLTKLASSKSEAKRLIIQKALDIEGENINDWKKEILPKDEMIIKLGKRKFLKIKIKD